MADIRTLLHEAAPRPVAPLDMAVIRARAERRPVRRLLVWVAGIGAVVGFGVPTGSSWLLSPGDSVTIDVVPAPAPSTPSPVGPSPSGREVATADATGQPSASESQPPPSGSTSAQAPAARGGSTTTTTAPRADYPAGTACSVDTYGLALGDQRRCRFTATVAGGWNLYQPTPHPPSVAQLPDILVRVRRNGIATTYRPQQVHDDGPAGGYTLEGCDDAIIRPGDLVEVVIAQPHEVWMDLRTEMGVGAGEGWGCTDPGP